MTITWKNNINIYVLNYTRSKFCLSVTIFQQGMRERENNYHKAVSGVSCVYFSNSLQNIILVVLNVIGWIYFLVHSARSLELFLHAEFRT